MKPCFNKSTVSLLIFKPSFWLSQFPQLVFPNKRYNSHHCAQNWKRGYKPYDRVAQSMAQKYQPIHATNCESRSADRHYGVELGVVLLPN